MNHIEKDISIHKKYNEDNIFFDPSKSSPPNNFLLKLHQRMALLDSTYSTKIDTIINNKMKMNDSVKQPKST